ncbi:MAG: hypothetical protein ABR924_23670 [Terracidiphilus sp.]|jgi:hypothetical protein
MASNCWVKPSFKLGDGEGVMAIKDNVGKDLVVEMADVVIGGIKVVDVEVGVGVDVDVGGVATNVLLVTAVVR